MKKIIVLYTFFALMAFSCGDENTKSFEIELTGSLTVQGITTYQYGTHVLSTDSEFYALQSDKVNLDDFVNTVVTIKGNKIEGYPVDGGPDYIKVVELQ